MAATLADAGRDPATIVLRRLADVVEQLAVTLWVGGLWVVGFVVAPTLFEMLPDLGLALAGLKQQALPGEVMHSMLRDRFAAWHGVAGALYVIECALGLVLVAMQTRAPR